MRNTKFGFLILVIYFFLNSAIHGAALVPCDVSEFVVKPNSEAVLRFRTTEPINDEISFVIHNTDDQPTAIRGALKKNGEFYETKVSLDQGYWEIVFANPDCRFGIVSVPEIKGKHDPFFAIDGALSWLVKEDQLREGIIRSAKRVGITMVRERFRLSGVAPEKDRFDWETGNRYDKLRNYYREQGMEIQELFHDAPAWMGKTKVYPKDLVAFSEVSGAVAGRWEKSWGGVEMWNEPDIFFGGNLPADQYVAVLRAFVYKMRENGVKAPIIAGVVAHFNEDWLETGKANGMLDLVDVFSFHTYDRAPNMQRIVKEFRTYLDDGKYGAMPLWLTECGRPWKKGPPRPPMDQDFESACDITMKGVESKCCGVAKYFPFVLPYYEENDNNFGMLGKSGTPLRSFAAYAQLIRRMSHCKYLGDLRPEFLEYENATDGVKRARVLRKSNGEVLLVLYTDQKTPLKVKPKFKFKNIERLTGENGVADKNGFVEITDGLVYLQIENFSEEMIDGNTTAMKLFSFVDRKYNSKQFDECNAPVISVYEFDEKTVTPNPKGYKLSQDVGDTFSASFRVHNLSSAACKISIDDKVPTIPLAVGLEIPTFSTKIIKSQRKIDTTEENSVFRFEVISNPASSGITDDYVQCLQFHVLGNPTLESLLKQYPKSVAIPIGKEHWTPSIVGGAKLDVENHDKGVIFKAHFQDGDRWCYPRLQLPENFSVAKTGSFFGRFRFNVPSGKDVTPQMFLFEQDSGSGYLSAHGSMLFAENEQWSTFRIPVTAFHYNSSTPVDPNGQLDTDQVKQVSCGFNTQANEVVFELDALYYCE